METKEFFKQESTKSFEIKEWIIFEDENVIVEKSLEKLIIKKKKNIDINTLVIKSDFIKFSKNIYLNLEKVWIINIYEKDWNKIFDISVKSIATPKIFDKIAEHTIQEHNFSMENIIYMFLLQNHIQSKKFMTPYDKVYICPNFYDNKKRKRLDPESIYIKEFNWKIFWVKYKDEWDESIIKFKWLEKDQANLLKKISKEKHNQLLIPEFLLVEESIFWISSDKIFVRIWLSENNLKYALENWFSIMFFTISKETFQNLIMKTFISGANQITKKHFYKIEKNWIKYIEII